ncbi:hypothetical protein [Psychroserpens sp. MEBiC05023]
MKLKLTLIIILSFVLSCNETKKEVERNHVPGEYFELENDNIKIYLPTYFEKFSESEYDQFIEALPDSDAKKIERQRFNYLKYSKGNIYYFRDIGSSTLISVKMSEFLPFTKEDSTYLLSLLSASCSEYAEVMKMNCEKTTAGYSGNNKTTVFKAAYKLTDGNNNEMFNTIYFIASNYKTFAMNIYSNNDKNYNAFIEKIVVR